MVSEFSFIIEDKIHVILYTFVSYRLTYAYAPERVSKFHIEDFFAPIFVIDYNRTV